MERTAKDLMSYDVTGRYHINRAELWPYDTVLDFGGKLRGYKKKGAITAAANAQSIVAIKTGAALYDLTTQGGWFETGAGGNHRNAISNHIDAAPGANMELRFLSTCAASRTSAPYDVHVLYEIA